MSSRSHHYFYNASAYGLSGEIERPTRHSIPVQAASTLAGSGGRGSQRIERFNSAPYVSFDAAYTEVGGSFDESTGQHATFAYSIIEKLDIAGMITADRIVARMAVYSPKVSPGAGEAIGSPDLHASQSIAADAEHSFDITGSYFENLKIAGYRIDVQLATHRFHQYQTYQSLADNHHSGADELQPWGALGSSKLQALESLAEDYYPLNGLCGRARHWRDNVAERGRYGAYWLSAAGHYDLAKQFKQCELGGVGGIICIPKFGVVHLAEVVVHRDRRQLHMIRLQMCSTHTGDVTGGGAGGGGSMPPPG